MTRSTAGLSIGAARRGWCSNPLTLVVLSCQGTNPAPLVQGPTISLSVAYGDRICNWMCPLEA